MDFSYINKAWPTRNPGKRPVTTNTAQQQNSRPPLHSITPPPHPTKPATEKWFTSLEVSCSSERATNSAASAGSTGFLTSGGPFWRRWAGGAEDPVEGVYIPYYYSGFRQDRVGFLLGEFFCWEVCVLPEHLYCRLWPW